MATGDAETSAEAQARVEATVNAFDAMSEAEAQAWLDAGDHSAVAGIPLTDEARSLIDEYAALVEVQGFSFGDPQYLPPGGISPGLEEVLAKVQDKSSPTLFLKCCTGKHFPSAKIT